MKKIFIKCKDIIVILSRITKNRKLSNLLCNEDAQQEIFNQLAKFSSDAIKAQQEFSARLGAAHPQALEEWNKSIDLFRSRYYSESGNDIRKSLEFLLRDMLENKTSIE